MRRGNGTKSKNQYKALKAKAINLESQSHRNNLQFDSLAECKGENAEELVLEYLCNSGFPYDPRAIERAHRLGPSITGKVRPIIVKFHHFKDREIVWKTDRAKLVTIARAALNFRDPHTHETPRVRLVADKLFINQQKFTVNNMDTLPIPFKPSTIYTPMNKDKAIFYSQNSPLSNHFPAPFTHKGEHFNCAEQYIMVEKARHFGDQGAVKAVMEEPVPAKQKQIGKYIKNFDREIWQANAQDIILPGLISKFEQCQEAMELLMKTAERDIIEANPHDLFFGVGISIFSPTVWDSSNYKGKNIMGKMLQIVRGTLIKK